MFRRTRATRTWATSAGQFLCEGHEGPSRSDSLGGLHSTGALACGVAYLVTHVGAMGSAYTRGHAACVSMVTLLFFVYLSSISHSKRVREALTPGRHLRKRRRMSERRWWALLYARFRRHQPFNRQLRRLRRFWRGERVLEHQLSLLAFELAVVQLLHSCSSCTTAN